MTMPANARSARIHSALLPIALAAQLLMVGGAAQAQAASAPAAKSDEASTGDKSEAKPTANAANEAKTETLSRVTVRAKRDEAETSFKADRSDTATRSGTDLMDVPSAITILTAKVLESQQALTVRDALTNVSSVASTSNPQGGSSYAIRGFQQGGGLVNGLGNDSAEYGVDAVERIEVLKGPQAVLAGSNLLGGAVNLVLKKPSAEPIKSLMLQYGSYGDRTAAVDLGDALSADKRLSYRLNASYAEASQAPSDVKYKGRINGSFLPQLRWKDEDTDFTVGASSTRRFNPITPYTMAVNGVIKAAPSTRLSNEDDGFAGRSKNLFYTLERKLSEDITLVSRLSKTLYTASANAYVPSSPIDEAASIWGYYATAQRSKGNTLTGDHYLRLELDTGPVTHKLSVGFNHTKSNSTTTQLDGGDAAGGVTVDVFSGVQVDFPTIGGKPSAIAPLLTKEWAYYAQDLMSYGDFDVSIGWRRNHYHSVASSELPDYPEYNSTTSYRQNHNSPSVGVVYKLNPSTAAYANYVEGFVPTTGLDCNNQPLKPTTSVNKEVGLKFDLLDNRLSATISAFELIQHNTAIPDSYELCSHPITTQSNRGLEFDLQGQIAPGWNAIFNYAHSHYTTPTDVQQIGNASYPKHKASFWTTYDFQGPQLKGWGVGVGATAVSKSEGSIYFVDRFLVPGSIRMDMNVSYKQPRWSLIFGMKDMFDAEKYRQTYYSNFIPLAVGRTATLTWRMSFE